MYTLMLLSNAKNRRIENDIYVFSYMTSTSKVDINVLS